MISHQWRISWLCLCFAALITSAIQSATPHKSLISSSSISLFISNSLINHQTVFRMMKSLQSSNAPTEKLILLPEDTHSNSPFPYPVSLVPETDDMTSYLIYSLLHTMTCQCSITDRQTDRQTDRYTYPRISGAACYVIWLKLQLHRELILPYYKSTCEKNINHFIFVKYESRKSQKLLICFDFSSIGTPTKVKKYTIQSDV